MKNAIISAEIMSLLVGLLILYGNIFETAQKNKRRTVFTALLILTMLGTASDLVSWVYDGQVKMTHISMIFTWLSTVLCFVISAHFFIYIHLYFQEKRPIPKGLLYGMMTYCSVAVIVFGILSINGSIFYFENGVYYDGPLYDIYLIANAVSLLYALLIACFSLKYISLHDSIAIFAFVLFPASTMVINAVVPDFSMTYPAVMLSLLFTYIIMQSEHEGILLRKEEQRDYQMRHDVMTGLQNRSAFTERLEQLSKTEGRVGVIFCDINGLKYTNDHFGHRAGDKKLCDFAKVLTDCLRKDEIFRISGDEFVALLSEISLVVLEKRVRIIREEMEEFEYPLASIGYEHGSKKKLDILINSAEKKMYQDKEAFHEKYPQYKR